MMFESEDPEIKRKEERAAACRAELVLLGKDPEYSLMMLDANHGRTINLLINFALKRIDLDDSELERVRALEKLLIAKGWMP